MISAILLDMISMESVVLRRELEGQDRIIAELKRADGRTLHVRKATRPEPCQQVIYDTLGIIDRPGKTEKTII